MSRYVDADKIEGWFESLSFGEIIMKSDFDNNPAADVIPVPKGATNGDMIKVMLSNAEIDADPYAPSVDIYIDGFLMMRVDRDWWNAPYKGSDG